MLRCTINELFDWRFMQTDPNWGNFLFDRDTGMVGVPLFGDEACWFLSRSVYPSRVSLVFTRAA